VYSAQIERGRRGRVHMVVGFTTTYAISAYHHEWCEFESRSRQGVQYYVIKFVSDRSVVFSGSSSFLYLENWLPRYSWNIVESGDWRTVNLCHLMHFSVFFFNVTCSEKKKENKAKHESIFEPLDKNKARNDMLYSYLCYMIEDKILMIIIFFCFLGGERLSWGM
jgi:hypothetical protein